MPSYAALLRALNVGGANVLSMSDLRATLTAAGLTDVRTILQSGNVVFRSGVRTTARLEQAIATAIRSAHALAIDVCVRSAAEWNDVVADNPFPAEARRDPSHLRVLFFPVPPSAASLRQLRASIPGREEIRGNGRHAYAVFPDGIGRSKLTTALIERTLGTKVTGRNWNTVLRIAEQLASDTE